MSILIVFATVAYLAIGLGFAMLSHHELATGHRDRLINRIVAWSGILLWLPMLVVVALGAFYVSLRPANPQVPTMVARPGTGVAERRTIRRAARQV